ncbi:hypothetical protein AXG93_4343s1520 [Marchantia polymorpha subsp. ruderalis]|uniref:Uncharacterized protein n=1 Tax=Marchantia polymorpha subsp. ruderalis TaxID=1480154 RepID=A0A176VVD9_MARPO|nr:hypothetical protein AXG93_4343s1520 [Marchantia polymorpha subsp. ruderalis]
MQIDVPASGSMDVPVSRSRTGTLPPDELCSTHLRAVRRWSEAVGDRLTGQGRSVSRAAVHLVCLVESRLHHHHHGAHTASAVGGKGWRSLAWARDTVINEKTLWVLGDGNGHETRSEVRTESPEIRRARMAGISSIAFNVAFEVKSTKVLPRALNFPNVLT